MKPFCGPKCSLCCTLLSVWGIIQLGLMAIFFYVRCPAFIEDLGVHGGDDPKTYLENMDKQYNLVAINCGIAAICYCVTLVISGWQWYVNSKA